MEALGGWEAATLVASSGPLVPKGGDIGGHAHFGTKCRLQLRCCFLVLSGCFFLGCRNFPHQESKRRNTSIFSLPLNDLRKERCGQRRVSFASLRTNRRPYSSLLLVTLLTGNSTGPIWVWTTLMFVLSSWKGIFPFSFYLRFYVHSAKT